MKERFYTAAPEAYDWSQVVESRETDLFDDKGRRLRTVVIDDEIMGGIEYQTGRYLSGLYPAYSEKQLLEEMRRGYVKVGG